MRDMKTAFGWTEEEAAAAVNAVKEPEQIDDAVATPFPISITRVAGDRYLKYYRAKFALPSGGVKTYEMASRREITGVTDIGAGSHADAVTIFAVSADGERMLVTDEYRFPVNDWTISVPSGLIDPGETADQAAVRELAEETGYSEVEVKRILPATYSSVGMTDERVQPVIAVVNDQINTGTDLGSAEFIRYRWVTREEARITAETAQNVTARAQLALLLFAAGQLL